MVIGQDKVCRCVVQGPLCEHGRVCVRSRSACTRTIARVPRHAGKDHNEQNLEIRRQRNLCMLLCCSGHQKLFLRDGRTRHSHGSEVPTAVVCVCVFVRACLLEAQTARAVDRDT